MVTTPFVLTRDTEDKVEQLMLRGEMNLALGALAASVDELMRRDELIGHALLVPRYDQQLAEISAWIGARFLRDDVQAQGEGCTLIVASETYATGGHSRVIEDLCRHVARPAIVLTDLFNRINGGSLGVDYLYRQAGDASVTVLPKGSLLDKSVNLMRLVASMRPRHILILGHHQDVIPYAALACERLRVPRTFVHHTDHHPALGCTIDAFQHVDLTPHVRGFCADALARPVGLLPLYVPDQGCKPHVARELAEVSIVTSGNPHKYSRGGPLAYGRIVLTACQTLGGAFHHIGALPDDWVEEIRLGLAAQGLDAERFVYHGPVPSLWAALKDINADVYLTSAPTGGGRAAIEAQGCGYPMVFHRTPAEAGRPLFVTDVYQPSAPSWSTLAELPVALRAAAQDSAAQSQASRGFYDRHFSEASFTEALADVLRHGEALTA